MTWKRYFLSCGRQRRVGCFVRSSDAFKTLVSEIKDVSPSIAQCFSVIPLFFASGPFSYSKGLRSPFFPFVGRANQPWAVFCIAFGELGQGDLFGESYHGLISDFSRPWRDLRFVCPVPGV